jgi:hypothetical protein
MGACMNTSSCERAREATQHNTQRGLPHLPLDADEGWCPFDEGQEDYVRMQAFSIEQQAFVSKTAFIEADRLVDLMNNPYVSFAPPPSKAHHA